MRHAFASAWENINRWCAAAIMSPRAIILFFFALYSIVFVAIVVVVLTIALVSGA
jgi:hypothetical protein